MAIKESALSLITSIAQGDWIRAVTSAGASRRVTVANLAKAIIESYTGSSLAGSNQSVKSALDSLNSKTTGTASAVSGSDVSNLSVRQYGKVVVINGYVSNATLTANTGTHIATISGVSLPTEGVRTVCGVAANAYNHPADVAYLNVSTDGKIYVTSTINGSRAIWFTASYII